MRSTDTAIYSAYSLTREQAEPFAIRTMRTIFLSYPPQEQERIRADVARKLADERRSREFQAQRSALARYAGPVYDIREEVRH